MTAAFPRRQRASSRAAKSAGVSWQGSGSQWRAAAVLAVDVADVVLAAPGVVEEEKDLLDAVLEDDDELPPQPVSRTKAVSAAMTPAKRRRANASTFVASMAVMSPTRLRMPPPKQRTNL
jgi:hypothetical protein